MADHTYYLLGPVFVIVIERAIISYDGSKIVGVFIFKDLVKGEARRLFPSTRMSANPFQEKEIKELLQIVSNGSL
jgi:hypothetical protein